MMYVTFLIVQNNLYIDGLKDMKKNYFKILAYVYFKTFQIVNIIQNGQYFVVSNNNCSHHNLHYKDF